MQLHTNKTCCFSFHHGCRAAEGQRKLDMIKYWSCPIKPEPDSNAKENEIYENNLLQILRSEDDRHDVGKQTGGTMK